MRSRLFLSCLSKLFLAVLLLMSAPGARAETGESNFTRMVTPVDPVTLQAKGERITLWGIKATGDAVVDLKAVELMDNVADSAAVTCKSVGGTATEIVARCADHTGEDIGLELLEHGYVIVDRHQDLSAVPAYKDYVEAQQAAHRNGVGVWRQVAMIDKTEVPAGLQIALGLSPVAGLALVAFMIFYRLKRLETQQQEDREQADNKENQLLTRERHVLVSTLQGELNENKNRIEVFLTIYGAMLENLNSKTETPKYQQSGDIVQKHPSLSKMVFETSSGKFTLLDMKLAAQLSKLYASLPKEQEYINIEPGVPLDSAVALVEKVLHEAEALMPPITAALAALDEFVAHSKTETQE
jgi:hypothetical protein